MRNITQRIRDAFFAFEERTVGNTSTNNDGVWLHGNQIIKREKGKVWWTLAGWNTPTTRDRLNGILEIGVYQHKFEPYVGREEISSTDWYLWK